MFCHPTPINIKPYTYKYTSWTQNGKEKQAWKPRYTNYFRSTAGGDSEPELSELS